MKQSNSGVMTRTLAIVFVCLAVLGCDQKSAYRDISSYYFPVDDLEDGYVYIYNVFAGLPYENDIWFYKKIEEENGDVYLSAQQYDVDFNVVQFQLQSIRPSGALLDRNVFYSTSEQGKAVANDCKIIEDNHFPFQIRDSLGIYLSSMSFTDIRDSTEITLIRNRRFVKDTLIELWGEEKPAIIMAVKEAYDYDKEGVLTVESRGFEIYADQVGLVYSRKILQDSFEVSYGLDTFYLMDNFLEEIELQQ